MKFVNPTEIAYIIFCTRPSTPKDEGYKKKNETKSSFSLYYTPQTNPTSTQSTCQAHPRYPKHTTGTRHPHRVPRDTRRVGKALSAGRLMIRS